MEGQTACNGDPDDRGIDMTLEKIKEAIGFGIRFYFWNGYGIEIRKLHNTKLTRELNPDFYTGWDERIWHLYTKGWLIGIG